LIVRDEQPCAIDRTSRLAVTLPIIDSENSMSSVQETVFNIIAKEAGIDVQKITPESTLKELEIQSLDAVQIIFEIEDHYKITLPDRDPNFDTESVKGLVEAVEKLLAEQQAGAPPT
jgi:acyl carrier protein